MTAFSRAECIDALCRAADELGAEFTQTLDPCSHCFPDGEIPPGVDWLVIGSQNADRYHLSIDYGETDGTEYQPIPATWIEYGQDERQGQPRLFAVRPTTLISLRTLFTFAVLGVTAMSNRFEDMAAVVTGGASGNGRAIATRFASEGASVTIADVREDPRLGGTPTHERINQRGGEAQFIECDVQSIQDIRDTVAQTVDAFGSLDVMVNNAGIDRKIPVEDVTEGDFALLCDINLNGVYFGCQAAIEAMRDQPDGGSIINISSIAGLFGFPDTSMYCATKGGVTNLTKALATEVAADGIRVNAINPGIIETAATVEDEDTADEFADDIPLGRIGQPEDVGNVAAFLASEDASYVTGHNLVVDGGIIASPN